MVIIGREEIKNNCYTLKKLSMNQEMQIDSVDSLLKNLK